MQAIKQKMYRKRKKAAALENSESSSSFEDVSTKFCAISNEELVSKTSDSIHTSDSDINTNNRECSEYFLSEENTSSDQYVSPLLSTNEDDSDENEPETTLNIKEKLAQWAVTHRQTRVSMTELLKILNDNPGVILPSDLYLHY